MMANPADALASDALEIFAAALAGVRPDRLVQASGWRSLLDRDPTEFVRIVVVGAGKAALPMAAAIEDELEHAGAGTRVKGLVCVPKEHVRAPPPYRAMPRRCEVVGGSHPVPDANGVRAGGRTLELARSLGPDDLLLVLLSGGGSALWPAFAPGIGLGDAQRTVQLLLASGATIQGINTVRKHLSRIAGGRLASVAFPAQTVALVISDVVGDELASIGSGPTVADPSTFEDAVRVLREHGLWDSIPGPVRRHLERGFAGETAESPKPGDPRLARSATELVGTNRLALDAAAAGARRLGYAARVLDDSVVGEARHVGRELAASLATVDREHPQCLLWGGETTVSVRGKGKGGRNQEFALAAALGLDGVADDIVLLSAGTDGIDGPTDAAGAWSTPRSAGRARSRGLDPAAHLEENNAYAVFDALDALIRTGPTHTNVMDVKVGLVARGA